MHHSGLFDFIGQENIFADEELALDSIYAEVLKVVPDAPCRLLKHRIGGVDGVKTWL